MREELLKGLTEKQIKKVKECKSPEEILALAKAEGVELTDEQLEAVNGGACEGTKCPKCGSSNTGLRVGLRGFYEKCNDCDYEWYTEEWWW